MIFNDNLRENLQYFKERGYKYVVKCQDKFLTNISPYNKKHIHLIVAHTEEEKNKIISDLLNDNTLSYVNWYLIDDYRNMYQVTYNRTFSLRNDWTRAFDTEEEKEKYMGGGNINE